MAYSLTAQGKLSEAVDIFGNVVWDATRLKAQRKGEEMRQQGFVGAAMLPMQELEYSAFRHSLAALEAEFQMREAVVHTNGHSQEPVMA
jgi:fructose 1,6-bisphosphate aldolase/phosphatase